MTKESHVGGHDVFSDFERPHAEVTAVTWAWPWFLAIAGVTLVITPLFHVWNTRRAKARLHGIVAPRLRDEMLRSVHWGRRWFRTGLWALSLALIWAALARPQHGMEMVETERPSVDFLIALDLSRSMQAEDMDRLSRLDAARTGIKAMLDEARGSRVGLVAFAGEAFLAAPITSDHEAVKRQLESLSFRTLARQGSDLAQAITLSTETFATSDYETKALVFVTDGEELQGRALIAARDAATQGLRVFTIGVGSTAGARIPLSDQNDNNQEFVRNELNRDVFTRLNEPMLRQIAAAGGGIYAPLGIKGEGLRSLWKEHLRPMARTTQPSEQHTPREYFQWPLAAALFLLLLEMLIRDRRTLPHHPTAA